MRRRRSFWLVALLAFVGYVAGAELGLALRFPPATTSILWPPNAILAAALMLVPFSRWPACFLGTFAAHLLVQLYLGWQLTLILPLFVTNCFEALLAAGGVRFFVPGRLSLRSLRDVIVVIGCAGLLAPIVSSFADAAVVRWAQDEAYWRVWQTRVFSNTLSELSFVPLILAGAGLLTSRRRLSQRQVIEAVLLGAALVFVSTLVLGSIRSLTIPGVPQTPTVFLVPFFLWAAVRFGAGGISSALLISALIASISAIRGTRAFVVLSPDNSLIALQLYLILLSIPLFIVSALIEERRQAAADLARRLKFEQVLRSITATFVTFRRDEFQTTVASCLQQIGDYLDADRVVLMQQREGQERLEATGRWSRPGAALPNPPEATNAVRDHDLITPFNLQDGLRAALTISTSEPRAWGPDEVAESALFGKVLGNALARERTEYALQASEAMKTAILASLSSLVAVIDDAGRVIAVNDESARFAVPMAGSANQIVVGVSYLDLYRRAIERGSVGAESILRGIDDVLRGASPAFYFEYRVEGVDSETWHALSAVPLLRATGGAVITHTNITERRLYEMEAQRARQELGHFARLATMGELTASLAHQLNQPLAGILSNAQAAKRYLDRDEPDLAEVKAIITDIIEDDRRAAQVIRRVRDVLAKDISPPVSIDINALIREVAQLLKSDSIIRNVNISFDLTPGIPSVRGNRVDLQQVVLNLLVNAMEAVADQPIPSKVVRVRSEAYESAFVRLVVEDSGPGLAPGSETRVFEPFYTTKPSGMGMGLAVARAIVESHGGRVWTDRNGNYGAAFHVTLPAAPVSAS
ncbi:MAG TPA: MASE1 domain-containing protein [Vicinamibacterales bacterium]